MFIELFFKSCSKERLWEGDGEKALLNLVATQKSIFTEDMSHAYYILYDNLLTSLYKDAFSVMEIKFYMHDLKVVNNSFYYCRK